MITIRKKTTNELEKMVFFEMKNKQFAILPNTEYYETYSNLSLKEKVVIIDVSNEIHDIWTCINTKQRLKNDKTNIHSINEYNELIKPVSEIILKVASKYNLTLRNKLTDKFKNALKEVFGKDHLIRFIDEVE